MNRNPDPRQSRGSGRVTGVSTPDRRRAQTAFSMIELVGVLAVMAILAAALVPALIRTMDRQAREQEGKALTQIREGLRRQILRSRQIPGGSVFAPAVATELGWTSTGVLTNARGLRRVYLLNPAITNALPIPYTQSVWGVTLPLPDTLKAVLLSSVGAELPTNLVNGLATTAAAFTNVWNTAPGAVPAGWTWNGEGDDLRIERLDLGSVFVPLLLNYDTWTVHLTNRGRFTIDQSTTNALPSSLMVYGAAYIRGTMLGLHGHNGTTGTLQTSEVLSEPVTFVYVLNTWRSQLFPRLGSRPVEGLDLQAAHDLFLAAPWNVNAKGSPAVTQANVVNDLINYMRGYTNWAYGGFTSSGQKTVSSAQNTLDIDSTYLLFKPK